MKAVVYNQYGAPDVLFIAQVQTLIPKDNEVLIRVAAAAVTSTDSTARKAGKLIERLSFGFFRPRNKILGTEFSGQIEQVGNAVTRFKPGDTVYGASGMAFGAHAEYICLPEDGALAAKPAKVTHDEAAAICEGGLTALPFLRDEARLQAGQKVLINGASGSVGTSAIQLAKILGAHVTAVCSSANVELVLALGADDVIDYTEQDFTRSAETYDVVFDAVGLSSYGQCKRLLAPEGVYLNTVMSFAIMRQMAWSRLFGKQRAKIAFTGLRAPGDKAEDLVFLSSVVQAGRLKSVLEKSYPAEQIAQAHERIDSGRKTGQVVMVFD